MSAFAPDPERLDFQKFVKKTVPDERAAIRAFLLTLEGKNGLQIADAIEDYLAPYARRLEEKTEIITGLERDQDELIGEVSSLERRLEEARAALEDAYDLYDAGESAASAYERGDLGECKRQHRRAEGIKERMREVLARLSPPPPRATQ